MCPQAAQKPQRDPTPKFLTRQKTIKLIVLASRIEQVRQNADRQSELDDRDKMSLDVIFHWKIWLLTRRDVRLRFR